MPKIDSASNAIVGVNKFRSSNRKPAIPKQSRVCQPSSAAPTNQSLFDTLNTRHGSFHFGCYSDSSHYLEYKFMTIITQSLKDQLIQDPNFKFNPAKINDMIFQGIHDFKQQYPFNNYNPKISFSMIYIDNHKMCHGLLMGDALITLTSSDHQEIYSGLTTSVTLDEFLDHFLDSSLESNMKKLIPKTAYLTTSSIQSNNHNFQIVEFQCNDDDTVELSRLNERGLLKKACYDCWYIQFQSWNKKLAIRANDPADPEFTLNDYHTFRNKGARYFEQMVRSFFPNLKESIGPSFDRHGQRIDNKPGTNFDFSPLVSIPTATARSNKTLILSLNNR